jgi:YidC/Oxa1 family membrane protein insertase
MIVSFFHTTLYTPIYNLLIFITSHIPGGDVGIAVIVVTLIVKFVTMPLALSALKTQKQMKHVEPELKKIKEKFKDNREMLAKETFALYKNNGIKPFSSILLTLVQLPVILSLYLVFAKEPLLHVDLSILYSFVSIPENISPLFLNYFPITGHSILLAVVAAGAQFILGKISIPIPEKSGSKVPALAEDFGRNMAIQARYVLPFIIAVVAYTSGAIALYLITASVVGLFQEFFVRRQQKS